MGLEKFGFSAPPPPVKQVETSYGGAMRKGYEYDNTTDQMWKEAHPWLKEVEKTRNHTYMQVEYRCEIGLDNSRTEEISVSTAFERPIRVDENDSYGGSWGTGTSYTHKNANELVEDILEFFKAQLEVPFKERGDDHFFRSIKREDVRLLITEKAKEFITKHSDTTWEELNKQIAELPETELTQEFEDMIKEYNQLENDIGKMSDKRWKIERLIDKQLQTEPSIIDAVETTQSISKYTIEFFKVKANLRMMKDKCEGLRKKVHHWRDSIGN